MEREYSVIAEARDLVNGIEERVNVPGALEAQLPLFNYEAYLDDFDTYQRMAYPALVFVFFQDRDKPWSVSSIIYEVQENQLSFGEDDNKVASAIKFMVDDLEELNAIEFLDSDQLVARNDRDFRFRNDNRTLAVVFDYISYLALIHRADEQITQKYDDLSQIFKDAALTFDTD